jgi:hypothetical protein
METIKQCIEFNREQEELGKLENDHPTLLCPYCAWPLKTNSQGQVACPICEKVWD